MSKILYYYFHCRNKLGIKVINIHNELLELFEQEVVPSVEALISLKEEYLKLSHKDFSLEASKVKLDKFKFKIDYSEENKLKHIQFYSLCRFQLVSDTMLISNELKRLFKSVPSERVIINWSYTFWIQTDSKYRPNEIALKEKNRLICVKNEEANSKILELNKEVTRLNNEIKKRVDYEELLNEYKQEISVKDAKAQESKLKIAELGTDLKALNKKFTVQLDTNIKNETKIAELEKLVKKYKEEVIINETKAKESISKIYELEKGQNNNAEQSNLQMENLRKEISRLKRLITNEQEISNQKKEAYEEMVNKFKEEISKNSIQYEKLSKDFTELQIEYNEEEMNFKEIKKFNKIEIDKQEKENIELRISNDSKETEINKLKKEFEIINTNFKDLQLSNESKETEINKLKKEFEIINTNFNNLQQSQQLKVNEQQFDLRPKLNRILNKTNYLLNLLKNEKNHIKNESFENDVEFFGKIEESLNSSKQMVINLLRDRKKIESEYKKLNFYYSKLSESNRLTEQLLRVKSDTIENLQKDLIRDGKGKRSSYDEDVIIIEHNNNQEFKEEKLDSKKMRNL